MSEDKKEKDLDNEMNNSSTSQGTQGLNDLELALLAMEEANSITLEDVEKQEAENAKAFQSFVKIPAFSTKDLKTYEIRLLPLKPIEGEPPVKDIVYPIHQAILKVETESKPRYVNIVRPDYAGIDGDLLRYYRKRVLEIASENNDKQLKSAIDDFKNGSKLKYDSKFIGYALDHQNRTTKDGSPNIVYFSFSFTQMKSIKDVQMSTWREIQDADGETIAPIFTSLKDAYRLKIIKSKENNKINYTFVNSARQNDTLSEEEILAWYKLPTIPEQFYKYTRYAHEGLVLALKQWDAKFDLNITEEADFIDLEKKVLEQIPASDTSSFLSSKKKDEEGEDGDESSAVTLDDLVQLSDKIEADGLDPKESEEAGDLRSKIEQFIKDEDLSVKITRTKSNATLIDLIVDELEERSERTRGASK